MIFRDEDGHVVAAARAIRHVHQRVALLAGLAAKCQDLRNPRIVDHVGQAVGAEQHDIAVHQLKAFDLDEGMCAGRADGIGQDVLQVLRPPLDGCWPLRVGEVPLDGVIARQLREMPVSKQESRE